MSTIIDNMHINEGFKSLGFSENEVAAYLALAESGKATVQSISRRAKLPRTTTYFVLENLLGRGVVSQEKKRGTTFFTANNPSCFIRLLREQKSEILKKEETAKVLAKALEPYFKSSLFHIPTLQFFEGKEKINQMLEDNLPVWMKSIEAADNIWWGYQDEHFVTDYRKWLEHYWQIKASQQIQLFSNISNIEGQITVPGRTIKSVPEGFEFQSTFWVAGDFIVVIKHRQKPQFAFQIKDPTLAGNLKAIFALLWNAQLAPQTTG